MPHPARALRDEGASWAGAVVRRDASPRKLLDVRIIIEGRLFDCVGVRRTQRRFRAATKAPGM